MSELEELFEAYFEACGENAPQPCSTPDYDKATGEWILYNVNGELFRYKFE